MRVSSALNPRARAHSAMLIPGRYELGPYLRCGQDRFGIHGWTRGRSPNLFVAGRGVSGVFPTLHKREQFFGVQGNFRHPRIVQVCCGRREAGVEIGHTMNSEAAFGEQSSPSPSRKRGNQKQEHERLRTCLTFRFEGGKRHVVCKAERQYLTRVVSRQAGADDQKAR